MVPYLRIQIGGVHLPLHRHTCGDQSSSRYFAPFHYQKLGSLVYRLRRLMQPTTADVKQWIGEEGDSRLIREDKVLAGGDARRGEDIYLRRFLARQSVKSSPRTLANSPYC